METLNCLRPKPGRHPKGLRFLEVAEGAKVEVDRGGAKLVDLFNRFCITDRATNPLTKMVRLQSRCCSHWLVGQVMQLGCVPLFIRFSLFCNVKNLVASVSKPLQSQVNILTQLLRDYQLAFNRSGLHLKNIKTHPVQFYNKGSPATRAVRQPLVVFSSE